VEIKNTHIQPKTKIGRLSFLGDSVVGYNVRVNSGVTIMNHIPEDQPPFIIRGTNFGRKIGSVLGDDSDIGANVVLEPRVITKHKEKIPPGIVIRAPLEES
jgi:bifunctional UDP-N-acetylglucosamine pyrophosphorylase/glucosamine-1-phosphate N-acetyltransferase